MTKSPERRFVASTIALAAAVLGLCAFGCGIREKLPERPNLVLVVLCSFRLDHSTLGGYERPTTPFLAEFAASGLAFENAVSASSWTKPATASLLSGLTPNVHNLWDEYSISDILKEGATPNRVLSDGVVTLPEALREAGYATVGWINNVNAGEFFNLTQGFDEVVTRHRLRAPEMLDELAAWLGRRDAGRPFFCLLFLRDAHTPYTPDYATYLRFNRSGNTVPEEEFAAHLAHVNQEASRLAWSGEEIPPQLRRSWIDLYDAALVRLDRDLARLPVVLDRAGVAAETLMVVTADHGEHFFDPGLRGERPIGHGQSLGEPLLHIPLVFRGSGIPAGRRLPQVVRSIDLYPTLTELAGATPPAWLQGRSLLPLIVGGGEEEFSRLEAFASRAGVHHVLRQGRYKIEREPERRMLYDVIVDPHATRDLWHEQGEVARRLDRALDRWLAQEQKLRPIFGPRKNRKLNRKTIEQLRSLGYL